MIRLHEFVTKIRNCKTLAEQRAEYQKQMSAIRESFKKNQEALRPRNVTKLLFINMSGQETSFGQMECLKLIAASSLIQKRIGYLGLTQLFHQNSELLMMATHRLRVDLGSPNNNVVGLTLCVLSQICTVQLSKSLHEQVLKCINNPSSYIRKKAVLTGIKIIKKSPQYISEFLPKISHCLTENNRGVILGCIAFVENILQIDTNYIEDLVKLVPSISRIYRTIAQQHSFDNQFGGVQDPFLQVGTLRFLKNLLKASYTFEKQFTEVLVIAHDNVCSKMTSNIKNGAYAVLFECFQCFMALEPTTSLKNMVNNVLSKFISVKDANSKYLSLFNLKLMTKYDLKIVKSHKGTIFECLTQNDILIRVMALDLLYLIAGPQNSSAIIKQLLNILLTISDDDFISELSLKICLIIQKYSQSRRWHFDTVLKVLILADQSIKEESIKSLVHLVSATKQLQTYCMIKLFFSTNQNMQNNALWEFAQVLINCRQFNISFGNIIDLIEGIVFKNTVKNDTISYALSCLLKLYEKFHSERQHIKKIIATFESHNDLQVQKRACQYMKIFGNQWDDDRKRQICIPIPVFRITAEAFKDIAVGQTDIDLDLNNLKMPKKMSIKYESHIDKPNSYKSNTQQVVISTVTAQKVKKQQNLFEMDYQQPVKNQNEIIKPEQMIVLKENKEKQLINNDDPFGILELNMPATKSVQSKPIQNISNLDFINFGVPIKKQQSQYVSSKSDNKEDFLGLKTLQTSSLNTGSGFTLNKTDNDKILAYQNEQIQIWMTCHKESADTTKIIATYSNRTQSRIQNISIQIAVMKYLKLTINALNNTTLEPLSKEGINQSMTVVNSSGGQKSIVMKIKLSYTINGQKLNFQQKISNFPPKI